ncbi:Gentisate transporter [Mycolicibacterium vanbaalenii]|uniref:Gentisate transporter n=1 Tax=Mycolicibacterium vanbaalenii TaxID=110539 RepID=A0A5S9QRL5_MYCVN|nr:MFS transporter [Mycolicibacterium vanbaalenii]CAA0120883.1 Gentisate transporter [Mycolicibacterium vanbaalenii]
MSIDQIDPTASGMDEAVPKGKIYLLGLLGGLQMLDPTVANTSMVEAGRELGFTAAERALGASVSTLALAATVLAAGLAADRLGRRRVLIGAALLAAVGNMIVAAAPAAEVYLAGRAIAGIGLGATLAATFAYVRFVTPGPKISAALGLWSAVMISMIIVGLPIGGALAAGSWRLAMLLVPAVLIALVVLVPRVLPIMPRSGDGPVDYAGLVLIGASTVLLLYGLSQAATSPTSLRFYGPVSAGIVGYAVFGIVEIRSRFPAFPVKLFTNGIFVAAVVAGVAWNFTEAVVMLSTSNLWQYTKSASPLEVTVLQAPLLVILLVASILVGNYLSKHSDRLRQILGLGFTACVLGFLLMAAAKQSSPAWVVVPGVAVVGAGLALISVPQSVMFVSQAPARYFGPVTSFRTTVGQIGYAMGLTLSVVLVEGFGHARFAGNLQRAGLATPSQVAAGIDDVRSFARDQVEPTTAAGKAAVEAAEKAYTQGFDATMVLCAAFIALMGVVTVFMIDAGGTIKRLRRRIRPASGDTHGAP